MKTNTMADRITALAPVAETLDQHWAEQHWAEATLARILAHDTPRRSPRRNGRWVAALAFAGVLSAGTGAAVAATGVPSIDSVKRMLLDFSAQPNTSGNVGDLHKPRLVAEFGLSSGRVFAVWVATTSSGKICNAQYVADSPGDSTRAAELLEGGCGGMIVDPTAPYSDNIVEIERADQLGGFLQEDGEPILYGVSPFPDAAEVRVRGAGVDRTLPVRADSLGYGSALPEATNADTLTLTFLDPAGGVVGTKTVLNIVTAEGR